MMPTGRCHSLGPTLSSNTATPEHEGMSCPVYVGPLMPVPQKVKVWLHHVSILN